MNEPILSPSELEALTSFGVGMFADAKNYDSMVVERGTHNSTVSNDIKRSLIEAERASRVQSPRPPTVPQYQPYQGEIIDPYTGQPMVVPEIPQVQSTYIPGPGFVPNQPIPYSPQTQPVIVPNNTPHVQLIPKVDDGQMEFDFSKKEQVITNELLEKIVKRLDKIINLFSKEKEEPIKLKSENKHSKV